MADGQGHECSPELCGIDAPEPARDAPLAVWSCWWLRRMEAKAAAAKAPAAGAGPAGYAPRPAPARPAGAGPDALAALDRFYWPGGGPGR